MEAYEQKSYTVLINYQFQVASHGWGCLWLICPQSIFRNAGLSQPWCTQSWWSWDGWDSWFTEHVAHCAQSSALVWPSTLFLSRSCMFGVHWGKHIGKKYEVCHDLHLKYFLAHAHCPQCSCVEYLTYNPKSVMGEQIWLGLRFSQVSQANRC